MVVRTPLVSFAIVVLLATTSPAVQFYSRMVETDLVEQGQSVKLELVFSQPDEPGPFPTMIFNHGSTGSGSDPSRFTLTETYITISQFFNPRGWLVVYPQRRGRGKSGGLYDEGFNENHTAYSCEPQLSLPGVERAMEDLDEVVRYLKKSPIVKPRELLIGGQSRGGILSVAYAGEHPELFLGVVNFVGGWMSDDCPDPVAINTRTFERGGDFPGNTLWLYGRNDPFYSEPHSRGNFDSFIGSGGQGEFKIYTPISGFNGHGVVFTPQLWQADMGEFVDTLPVPEPAVVPTILSVDVVVDGLVQVTFVTEPDLRYSLFGGGSLDRTQWDFLGEPVFANSIEHTIEFSSDPESPVFFIVRAD